MVQEVLSGLTKFNTLNKVGRAAKGATISDAPAIEDDLWGDSNNNRDLT